jgi:hypothetical protein
MTAIDYREGFDAVDFVALANRIWPRDYDLVGAVHVLTDGYLFSTVPEVLVESSYQRRASFFGAQPQSEGFFARMGRTPGPVGFVLRKKSA